MSQVEIELPERQPETPSNRSVLFVSLAAFSAIVLVGGAIGFLVQPSTERASLAASAAVVPVVVEGATEEPPSPASDSAPTATIATTSSTAAPTTSVESTTTLPVSTADETPTTTTTTTTTLGQPVAILEITKAVTDQFELVVGDTVLANIVDNDKGIGDDPVVRVTGLGELAPGFVLLSDGTLRGTADGCGRWQAQYALTSSNLGTSTSWIDVNVRGC